MVNTVITYNGNGVILGHFSCDGPQDLALVRFKNILGDNFNIIKIEERN